MFHPPKGQTAYLLFLGGALVLPFLVRAAPPAIPSARVKEKPGLALPTRTKPGVVAATMLKPSVIALPVVTPAAVTRSGLTPSDRPAARSLGPLTAVGIATVPNLLKWSDGLYSGGRPLGAEGYRALAALGIRTLVDVDGAPPDVDLARGYGIRCVHIPVEYSGIGRQEALEVIRATRDLPGPVFIHCHHGQHRAPAATALTAMALAHFDHNSAHAALQQAGTGTNYRGLWACVDEFMPPSAAEIDGADHAFPAVAPLESLTAAMVKIDQRLDGLQANQASRFKASVANERLNPAHQALLLREAFAELGRTEATRARGADFAGRMLAAQLATGQLEDALRANDADAADTALASTTAACASCHRVYRDVPPVPAGP